MRLYTVRVSFSPATAARHREERGGAAGAWSMHAPALIVVILSVGMKCCNFVGFATS